MAHIHNEEIKRWADSPTDTRIWYRAEGNNKIWHSCETAIWSKGVMYIVDDAFANVRKFFADNGYIWNHGYKVTNPRWDVDANHYSTTETKAEGGECKHCGEPYNNTMRLSEHETTCQPVYYWKWKKVVKSSIRQTEHTAEDLSKDGWTRVESSKTTFKGLI